MSCRRILLFQASMSIYTAAVSELCPRRVRNTHLLAILNSHANDVDHLGTALQHQVAVGLVLVLRISPVSR